MKRWIFLISVFLTIAVYSVVGTVVALNTAVTVWLGIILIVSALPAAIIAVQTIKSDKIPFPIKLSVISASAIYVFVALILSVCGMAMILPIGLLFAYQTACLTVYVFVLLALYPAGRYIFRTEGAVIDRVREEKALRFEYERVKLNTSKLNSTVRKAAYDIIDKVIEEIRFSDFDSKTDLTDADDELHKIAQMMSAEIDNMADIDSVDLSGLKSMADDAVMTIKNRNMQIGIVRDKI